MFALDVSDTVSEEGREAAQDFLQHALRQMKKGDQGGLVVFGADASVEASLQPALEVKEVASTVSGQATDIGHALELAMAQFPLGGKKRVVLLTDGNETQGSAQEMALVAQPLGVEVWSVPIGTAVDLSMCKLSRVLVPNHVSVGEPLKCGSWSAASKQSQHSSCSSEIKPRSGSERSSYSLGKTALSFPICWRNQACTATRRSSMSATDPVTENNRVIAFTEVMGKARILIAYGQEGPPAELAHDA